MEKHMVNHMEAISRTQQIDNETTYDTKTGSNALALPKSPILATNLQELDETVKAMMKTSENMVQVGNRQRRAKICKVCGKEGYVTDIMRHIETHHLEGLSVPCNLCDKRIRSRNALRAHMIKEHLIL